MSTQETSQSAIKKMTPELFRQKLAGLQKNRVSLSYSAEGIIQAAAISVCQALAEVFSDQLERMTLWERIGTGLQSSVAKVANDDVFQFFNECIEHVKADPGKVASSVKVRRALALLETVKKEKTMKEFLEYIKKYQFLILVQAREEWNMNKKEFKHENIQDN